MELFRQRNDKGEVAGERQKTIRTSETRYNRKLKNAEQTIANVETEYLPLSPALTSD